MRIITGMVLVLFALTAQASVYKSVSPSGEVTYSDVPQKGAVEYQAPAVNEVPSTLPGATSSSQQTDVNQRQPSYTAFQILSPSDQGTIQNQPVFTVKLGVEPELKAGDQIQLMLDDRPFGTPQASLEISMENVDRGTHRLYAVILDARGHVIKRSNEITIYVHRASVLNRPGSASRHRVHESPLLLLIKRIL